MTEARKKALEFKVGLETMRFASKKAAGIMHTMETAAVTAATALTTAGVAFAKVSLDKYGEFEKQVNNIGGVTQMGVENLEKYADRLKAVAKEINGITYTDSAETFYYESLAGWTKEQSMAALPAILKAVRISGEDTKTVSDAITDSMTALGLQPEQAQEYLDKAAMVQSKSNTNMLQLQQGLIKTGAGAVALDIPYEDMMTMLGVLASGGKKGEEGGTIANNLIARFMKTGGTRREAMNGLKALGIEDPMKTFYEDNGEGEFKGLKNMLVTVGEAVTKLTPAQKNNAMTLLGGSYFSQLMELAEAVKNIEEGGNSLGGSWDKINSAITDGNANGYMDKYIEYQNQGYAGKKAEFMAKLSNFETDAGEILAPYAVKAIDWMEEKLPSLQSWLENELPSALDKGEAIVKKIYEYLVWIYDHKTELLEVAAVIYGGSAAVRVGAGAMEMAETAQKVKKAWDKWKLMSTAVEAAGTVASTAGAGATLAGAATGTAATAGAAGAAGAGVAGAGAAAGTAVTIGTAGAAAAVVATAVALEECYRNSDKFKESIADVGTTAKTNFDDFIENTTGADSELQKLKVSCGELKSTLKETFGFLGDILADRVDIENLGYDTAEKIGSILATSQINDKLEEIRMGMELTNEVLKNATEFWSDFKEKATESLEKVSEKMIEFGNKDKNINKVLTKFKEINNVIKVTIDALPTLIRSVNSFLNGNVLGSVKYFKEAVNEATNTYSSTGTFVGPTQGGTLTPFNAVGTNYWKGGLTHINENGGEIVDLPQGTRIYPADKSRKMMSGSGNNITVQVNIENYYGDDERYINAIGNKVASKLATVIA